ncbi:hypothetical protein GGX14DRAFT_475850 [Mycena pura]|uniref:C5a peptidase/Subtilisin-like protease SBT2-like Fn3-like domain-containing protein n=1 Tax=Mycena pura TaxID=153505 RepID=A0AAD6Y1I5_9AGAR|nr:hypothetical protein GGX14DRAFT_475850 [Mycena pura]
MKIALSLSLAFLGATSTWAAKASSSSVQRSTNLDIVPDKFIVEFTDESNSPPRGSGVTPIDRWACRQKFTVTNHGETPQTYTLSHVPAGTAATVDPNTMFVVDGPVSLLPDFATVTFNTPKFTLSPGQSHDVVATITPTKVDAATFPVYSGFIYVTSGSESVHATYLGVAASLKDKAVIDNINLFFGVQLPLVLDSVGNVQEEPTFVGEDAPTILWRQAFGSPHVRLDSVPSNTNKPKAEKAASGLQRFSLVLDAAETTVAVLRSLNFPSAIFGSLACKLYGNSRYPKDADILVFPTSQDMDAQALKRLIVASAPQYYYLKNARDPAATYRILWFRSSSGRECKVDILVPGTTGMYLPTIPPARIHWTRNLPLAPFPFVLLHKLKAWAENRVAPETYKRVRQATDAADVHRLLEITPHIRELQKNPAWWTDEELFDAHLQMHSVIHVRQYCAEFPERAELWRALGFDVPECATDSTV